MITSIWIWKGWNQVPSTCQCSLSFCHSSHPQLFAAPPIPPLLLPIASSVLPTCLWLTPGILLTPSPVLLRFYPYDNSNTAKYVTALMILRRAGWWKIEHGVSRFIGYGQLGSHWSTDGKLVKRPLSGLNGIQDTVILVDDEFFWNSFLKVIVRDTNSPLRVCLFAAYGSAGSTPVDIPSVTPPILSRIQSAKLA
jgi:hypothetical protein